MTRSNLTSLSNTESTVRWYQKLKCTNQLNWLERPNSTRMPMKCSTSDTRRHSTLKITCTNRRNIIRKTLNSPHPSRIPMLRSSSSISNPLPSLKTSLLLFNQLPTCFTMTSTETNSMSPVKIRLPTQLPLETRGFLILAQLTRHYKELNQMNPLRI